MHVETLVVGPLATNCYVVSAGSAGGETGDTGVNGAEAIIIDPGGSAGRIRDYIERYGKVVLLPHPSDKDTLILRSEDGELIRELLYNKHVKQYISGQTGASDLLVLRKDRGFIKQALIKTGFPVDDQAGYATGEPFPMNLTEKSGSGTRSTRASSV